MEIVGLIFFVQDDVNKLIAKFVGLPVHPVSEMFKVFLKKMEKWSGDTWECTLDCEPLDLDENDPEAGILSFSSCFFDARGMGIFEEGYFDDDEDEDEGSNI